MRGLGSFQMAQMKHRDARVSAMCQHLRAAVDVWEEIAQHPFEKEVPEPPPPPMPAPPAPIVSSERLAFGLKEAATALGISRATLWRAIKNGQLASIKLGNRTLIAREVLQTWLGGLSMK